MRNFFKNTLGKIPSINTRQIAELLGTNEENVIRQYRECLKYISRVKNDILHKSENYVHSKRHLTINN